MINSRDLKDLHPTVRAKAEKLIASAKGAGIDLLITSTYRDHAAQDALYAQGRTKPGKKVTNARAGQSWHNWRVAFDVVPMRHGKPVWGTNGADGELWQQVGAIGKSVGLEWAGDWRRFKEFPHFQDTMGFTLARLNAGEKLPA